MAKFFDFKVIIILALLIWIVVQTCMAPLKYDPAADIYQDSVKTFKKEKAIISSRIASIVESSRHKEIEDSVKLAASLKEINRLKVKANQTRTPKVDTLILDNPELKVFVDTQDSVILTQGVLIDTLQSQLQFERMTREQLVGLHYSQSKIESQMAELAQVRIIDLEKDLKREKRKGKFKAVLIPIVGVAGLLLGTSL